MTEHINFSLVYLLPLYTFHDLLIIVKLTCDLDKFPCMKKRMVLSERI